MKRKQMDFEDINRHVEALDLEAFTPGGDHHFTKKSARVDPMETLRSVCAIYFGVRPIIVMLSTVFFLPSKWRQALSTFLSLMDQLCPQ